MTVTEINTLINENRTNLNRYIKAIDNWEGINTAEAREARSNLFIAAAPYREAINKLVIMKKRITKGAL